ncbi:MAG TPA: family 1 encapsulin nanocompartment shell protein [Streptosporangiaceae bacterium]|nr:family 1 encapsulin nanocompartment shell protein [Streptosporangiaceae bacterium]
MNNLHRELAPISAAAWASIEEEAKRTFTLNLAGRRVVDVTEPGDEVLSAVGTGHLASLKAPAEGVIARSRIAQPVVEFRVPFAVSREAVDDVERGAEDPDWQPVKDAARQIALAEDRAVFDGYAAAGIAGIRKSSSNAAIGLPADATMYPDLVSGALETLRLAGVGGPFALVLSAEAYTAVSETSDHGYPVRQHLAKLVDGPIVWAPAIEGAYVMSTRGGDFELYLGQDLSIGYLSHDIETVTLYFEEAFTFLTHTPEAVVPINP